MMSLGVMLRALGLKLIVAEDEAALAEVSRRYEKRGGNVVAPLVELIYSEGGAPRRQGAAVQAHTERA